MARFLFVYRDSANPYEAEMAPEALQQIMEQWNAWLGNGLEEGWLFDAGNALKLEGKVVDDEKLVSDGPFTEAQKTVGGYSIVQCADLRVATEIAKTCPAADSPGGTIEIRELAGTGSQG